MSGVLSMYDKTEIIYIRCTQELKERMKILFAYSGEKNYADFLSKLLDLYEILMNKTGHKKINDIIQSLNYRVIVVGPNG